MAGDHNRIAGTLAHSVIPSAGPLPDGFRNVNWSARCGFRFAIQVPQLIEVGGTS
jgi:hypothetical protein